MLTVEADDGNCGTGVVMVTGDVTDAVEMWSGTMMVGAFTLGFVDAYGYTTGVMAGDTQTGGPHGTLGDASFTYGGETYTVELAAFVQGYPNIPLFILGLEEERLPQDTDMALHVNGHRLETWGTTGLSSTDTMYYIVRNVDFGVAPIWWTVNGSAC